MGTGELARAPKASCFKTFTHGFRGENKADNEIVSQHIGETLDASLALSEKGSDGTRFRMAAVKIGGEDAHVLFTINKSGNVTEVDILKGFNAKRNPEGMKRVAPETLNADAFGVAESSIANFERVWQEQFKPGIEEHDSRIGRKVTYSAEGAKDAAPTEPPKEEAPKAEVQDAGAVERPKTVEDLRDASDKASSALQDVESKLSK